MTKPKKYSWEHLFLGNPQKTSLEERVFSAIMGLVFIMGSITTITNAIFLGTVQACIAAVAALVSGALYVYCRQTGNYKPFVFPASLIFAGIMTMAWLCDVGTYSSAIFYFFMTVLACDIVLERRHKNIFLAIVVGILTLLLLRELFYPPDMNTIARMRLGRLGDFAASIYLCIFIIVCMVRIVINQHIRDKKEIRKAAEEIKTLRGFLPICAKCKRIRDKKGYWNQLEHYITEHSQAEFTHSLCPECSRNFESHDKE